MLLSNPFSGIMLILLLPLASVTGVATVSHLHSELFTERHMVLMLSFFYSRICIVLFYLLVSWLHTWLCIHWPGMSMLHSNFLYISYICVLFITSLFFIFFCYPQICFAQLIGLQFSMYWWVAYSLKTSIVRVWPCYNAAAPVYFPPMENPQLSGNFFPHPNAPAVIWNLSILTHS